MLPSVQYAQTTVVRCARVDDPRHCPSLDRTRPKTQPTKCSFLSLFLSSSPSHAHFVVHSRRVHEGPCVSRIALSAEGPTYTFVQVFKRMFVSASADRRGCVREHVRGRAWNCALGSTSSACASVACPRAFHCQCIITSKRTLAQ